MKILVRGFKGFIGKNLISELHNRNYFDIYEYDRDTNIKLLDEYCHQADIVFHLADVNLCYSENARRYLNAEGVNKERTYVVGSLMAEVLSANLERINNNNILNDLNLKENEYILLSAHREENIDIESNFMSLMKAVNAMAEKYQMSIIYSLHPSSKKYIESRNFIFNPLVISH